MDNLNSATVTLTVVLDSNGNVTFSKNENHAGGAQTSNE
jgi:hypothetical protein